MTSTLALLVVAWAATVPLVLGLARLLGRLSAPGEPAEAAAAPVSARPGATVVPLVPRPRNALLPVGEAGLRQVS